MGGEGRVPLKGFLRPPRMGWILPSPVSPLLLTPPSHIKGTFKNRKGYRKAVLCFPSHSDRLVLFVLHLSKQSQTQNFMLNSKTRGCWQHAVCFSGFLYKNSYDISIPNSKPHGIQVSSPLVRRQSCKERKGTPTSLNFKRWLSAMMINRDIKD